MTAPYPAPGDVRHDPGAGSRATGECWAPTATVTHGTTDGGLVRAGQVVDVEWAGPGAAGLPYRALRVTPRIDLQAGIDG